jgi:protocatechuate 3,4-dioxygenase beta subunit
MGDAKCQVAVEAMLVAVLWVTASSADTEVLDPVALAVDASPTTQRMLELPVRVVDPDGRPVANARITPWALRSSQGHGWWRKDDKAAEVGPEDVATDKDGKAAVRYPYYRYVAEAIRTISVSIFVDHPDYAYVDGLHIDVPLETDAPYEVKLSVGVPLEVRPVIDGKTPDLETIFAAWSDGRSWQPGAAAEKIEGDTLRIPALPPGKNSVFLVKLNGDRATHFSKIVDLELAAGEKKKLDVPLRAAKRMTGNLSDDVPRPVKNGRIKLNTLPPRIDHSRVAWFTWVSIQPDGTFTFDWPADELVQLIALCDGYVATSGKMPEVVQQPINLENDPFNRPQVFNPAEGERIEVEMTPMARCIAKVIDDDNEPIAGVTVASWPNVGWWNGGSQIYCAPLVRGERLLRERGYFDAVEEVFPPPFQAVSDARGKVTIELPAGNERLAVSSDVYELPAFLGRRDAQVELRADENTVTLLRLQPRGTEKLGEWDKLAGVVFGCSTREGRRICALPGVQEQMNEFAQRFREAKNQRDPQLLSEAYAAVADAFANVGDLAESEKWQRKAAEQAANGKGAEQSAVD